MTDTLTTTSADDILRLIPHAATEAQRRNFEDLATQTKGFYLTLLATVPAGQRRDDAIAFLRRSVTAAVLGIAGPK